ncbi:MAG: 50S ribosomal protein L9 [Deltaproteobacteria bacterium]|nr:50S ribosomal protein L9 [Deltaproteobacteria bacterium]
MKVILLKDMDDLGLEGDIISVKNGYARNYLIPKDFALEASERNIKLIESKRKKIEIRKLKAREDALKIKEGLADLQITIAQKVGEGDKLYGSVTSMDIASEMEKRGVTIDRRKIVLEKPIKNLGEFKIPIKIYPGVTGFITVSVVPEEPE